MVSLRQKPTTAILLASIFKNTGDAQVIRSGNERLSIEELVAYQYCETDSDCIFANNGFCDCANGGEEVSVNVNMKSELEDLFSLPAKCTRMATTLPCGTGTSKCQSNMCVFKKCENIAKAVSCQNSIDVDSDVETCMRKACQQEITPAEDTFVASKSSQDLDIEKSSNVIKKKQDDPPFHVDIPDSIPPKPSNSASFVDTSTLATAEATSEYILVQGKLTSNQLVDFQECQADEDCIYATNGFCDCANGGEQTAVNKNMLHEFESLFLSNPHACTRKAITVPCEIGAGIKCEQRSGKLNRCTFEPCKNEKGAEKCSFGSNSRQCMQDICGKTPGIRGSLFPGFSGIFSRNIP